MSRNNQLESIQQITSMKEEDAAKMLAAILDRKIQAEQQLVDLINYRQDYENKMKLSYAQEGVAIEKVRQSRHFSERLSVAIRQQQALVSALIKEIEKHVELWRSSHASNKMIETLLQRHQSNNYRKEDRRQQAESEDSVYSRFFLKRSV